MTVLNQTDIIKVHRLGHTFRASRRTVACLDRTIRRFKRQFPEARLVIFQTPYNTGVKASEGSHDYDCSFDFGFTGKIKGRTRRAKWRRFERFMRDSGWGIWWRHTGTWAPERRWHLHGFPLPVGLERFSTRVGYLVDGGMSSTGRTFASSQLADYTARPMRNGLASHDPDTGWKLLRPIRETVFDYRRWVDKHGAPKGTR